MKNKSKKFGSPFNDINIMPNNNPRSNNFIKRGNIEFESYGRIHNLKQSKELDRIIKETYDNYGLSYIEVESRDAVDKIIPIVLKKLEI